MQTDTPSASEAGERCEAVLDAIEGAPAGTRGISLFLVPKYRVNDDGSLGEFKIWEYQLTELIGEGRVALVVYAHNDRRSVMAMRLVDPLELTRAGRASWVDHPTMGIRFLIRIPWTEVIPLKEVEIGARHHFAEHYPEEEAKDVFFLCESDEQIRLY